MTKEKSSFVRVAEVWVPTPDGTQLSLAYGQYGSLASFASESSDTKFARGEGLPGRAWELGHPIVFHELKRPMFVREEAAREAGLTCGVAIPIVKGDATKAVLVLFCGDDAEHIGAIEIWHAPQTSSDLKLFDGYFGTATKFEFQSKHISFRKGFGLPGLTWQSDAPIIMGDLGNTKRFLRKDSADQAGITRGLGIPLQSQDGDTWILALLSALGTPIADRFEVWRATDDGRSLVFENGLCESGSDLGKTYAAVEIPAGDTTIGRALRDGVPAISDRVTDEVAAVAGSCAGAELSRMVAAPIYSGDRLTSVVAWYN